MEMSQDHLSTFDLMSKRVSCHPALWFRRQKQFLQSGCSGFKSCPGAAFTFFFLFATTSPGTQCSEITIIVN